MRLLGLVGCTSSALKQRDVPVEWLRSWSGLRTDMINRFPNQTFVRLLCRLRLLSPPRNRDGRSRNHLSQMCMNQVMGIRMPNAPAKTEGGKESEKGKDARSGPKFIGHCFWCGARGHTKSDCRKKAAGKPRTARSPTNPSRKGRDESRKGSE